MVRHAYEECEKSTLHTVVASIRHTAVAMKSKRVEPNAAGVPLVDPLIGVEVTIRSLAGIVYSGAVRAISRQNPGSDELFELGRTGDASYQRLVHVADRRLQITANGAAREAGAKR
jgi:hypothetical protein